MKYSNIILFCALALGLASCSKSQIRMSFEGFTNDTVVVFSLPVEMFTTATDDSALTIDTLLIRNNRIDIARPEKTMSYIFSFRETDENSPKFSRRSIYVIATPEHRLRQGCSYYAPTTLQLWLCEYHIKFLSRPSWLQCLGLFGLSCAILGAYNCRNLPPLQHSRYPWPYIQIAPRCVSPRR